MALTSPGVEVTIIDQSQYLPAPTNSVPLVVLATAQNKANAAGTGVAAATTAANANKLYQVTSQRDLVDLYGTPFFYTTTNGTPIQGYELNEYGLLAAYSTLGVTNRCYVLRADIDLASLVGQTGRPVGEPTDGTYWLDTTTSAWGIYEFNASTNQFEIQTPIVITDPSLVGPGNTGAPLNTVGSVGNYAVNAIQFSGYTVSATGYSEYFYKNSLNEWVPIGSNAWFNSVPTVEGTGSFDISAGSTDYVTAGTITITTAGEYTVSVVVGATDLLTDVADTINGLNLDEITADASTGHLIIYSNQNIIASQTASLTFGGSSGTLSDLGISGTYYQPTIFFGTSAQLPLWQSSQTTPRPTGSVWVKVGSAGNGLNPVVSEYNTATASWLTKNVTLSDNINISTNNLDPTGGQAIPVGTVIGLYPNKPTFNLVKLLYRQATGPTVVTGTVTFDDVDAVEFTAGPYYMTISVSVPNSSAFTTYEFTLADNSSPQDFVDTWLNLGMPYTSIGFTSDNAIEITHTVGGQIFLCDTVNSSFVYDGTSNGLLEAIGIVPNETAGVINGGVFDGSFSAVSMASTTGSGSGATFNIQSSNGIFLSSSNIIQDGGTGFVSGDVGDTITISAASVGASTDLILQIVSVNSGTGAVTGVEIQNPFTAYAVQNSLLTNWAILDYTANEGAPNTAPANNTNWFYSVVDQVDIMVEKAGAWIGYGNTNYDSNGFPTSGGNTTDPNGPIVSATAPTTQSDGTSLAYGDLWIDTSDLELYPVISRWQSVGGVDQWVLIDNTDQTSQNGILFADARWSSNQSTISPVDDPIPTIKSLLTSNNTDLDAPNPALYPQGMLLFNTRRSGYNVKQYRVNYFNSATFPDESIPTFTNPWVSVSGNMANGAPYMGRKAQRAMVVQSLRSAIDTNTDIRDEDNYFNLIATPNYPELQPNMVVLNADRGETGYIIGDTPLGLSDSATDIQAWATNAAGATSTGEQGLVTRNTYLGLFYPSGITNDLSGNEVVVPASHMMLRTFLRNDTIAYPWLAAAGTRRGNIDNALNIGYLNRTTGEFVAIKTRLGIRDVLYINQINPLVFFTGIGLLNYGNKNSFNSQSALDRTNVARLINYVRRQLTLAARPFVFEPNDALTRNQIAGVIQTLMVDLVAKRGLYDYLVVCDESNNTPARIDRNELWVDVAIEPVKAAEFIYIPVRVLNTGEIASLG